MGLNIVDSEGKKSIHIDDSDQEKDTVIDSKGTEKSYNEVAAEKEIKVKDTTDESETEEETKE